LLGYPVVALTATIAILVVACPCALGLAVPTALVAACGRGSQLGLYFRNIQVIEKSGHIDTVVWDKTGTLTEGKMEVVEWFSEDPEILAQVGVLAEFSHHPVSKALAEYGQLQFGEDWSSWQKRYSVSDMQNLPGLGIKALVSGQEVTIGKRSLFEDQSLADNNLSFTDCSVVFAGRGGKIEAWGMIADTVRPSSYKAIQYLQKRKINNILLTGDNLATALKIAKQLGIDEVYADVLPEEKAQKIIELQNRHKTVAMVGDGINDAPALAQADLGINLGELELARQAADITILKADPWTVAEGFQLADRSRKIIRQNLAWAFSYNILLLPVASLGFLNPVWAGSAMALSSILVVTNSLRLRRFKLKGIST
jgi:Cu+-exporting ATPase